MQFQHLKVLWLLLRESVIFWTGISIIVWVYSASFIQDLLVYGAFIFALFHTARGKAAWTQPAGIAFIILLLHCLLTLPFSVYPKISFGDFTRVIEIIAGMFAIPVIFHTRARVHAALFYSALAITLTLTYDLVRLTYQLGPNLLAQAHEFRPFILNHSNVASMMAGAAALVLFYFCWIWRRQRWLALASLLSSSICLAYLIIVASRGPQLAFALTCACFGLLIPGWRRKLIGLAAAALLAVIVITQAEHINPRFAERGSMSSFSERDKVWRHTWTLAQQRPWFGYGYGKRNFEAIYYASDPPSSPFHYPHCHQFWLKLLFEFGWTGLLLHLAAWLILGIQLIKHIFVQPTFEQRLLPGTVALILFFIHCYGLGDYPDNIVQMAQFWLIPLALTIMRLDKIKPTEPDALQRYASNPRSYLPAR